MAAFDFDSIKDKAKALAQTGANKSKQVAEIAKLNFANLSEESNMKKVYLEIGKLYYAERGMAPEAAYAALCEKITASKVNVEENKNRIEELKKEGGITDAEVEAAAETAATVEDLIVPVVEPLAEEKKPEEPTED